MALRDVCGSGDFQCRPHGRRRALRFIGRKPVSDTACHEQQHNERRVSDVPDLHGDHPFNVWSM